MFKSCVFAVFIGRNKVCKSKRFSPAGCAPGFRPVYKSCFSTFLAQVSRRFLHRVFVEFLPVIRGFSLFCTVLSTNKTIQINKGLVI